ncbi:GNAT family acetyltransferase [Neofusicoccum parvum]|nr:GNAT family acetyltransferase [Neofusicoccum parvum]
MTKSPNLTRPLGAKVQPRAAILPQHTTFHGQHVSLRPLVPSDADALFPLVGGDDNAHLFDYLPYGPFADIATFRALVAEHSASTDPLFWAIVPRGGQAGTAANGDGGKPLGWCALMRIVPAHGVAELGHLLFAPALQRTAAATEALGLLARHVFEDLAYRRLEWKCNDLNAGSKRAAARLGFVWEGRFRAHMVVKGRSRDTAWFAMVEGDWFGEGEGEEGGARGGCGEALRRWLEAGNFDEGGVQRRRLEDVRKEVLGV